MAIKSSLHLSHVPILLRGKDENQALALSLSEKGNNFNFTISLYMSFFFCISQSSTKVLRCEAGSSLGLPESYSFVIRINNATLISKASTLVVGGIGVLIK